ncbi:hypothetical protein, partial [Mycoplasmoides pneumoniae]
SLVLMAAELGSRRLFVNGANGKRGLRNVKTWRFVHCVVKEIMPIYSSKFFDSIRIKPTKVSAKRQGQAGEQAVTCEWAGCQNKGAHRAPKGRENSREYWHFCLDHVREYNQSYNFFQGMNPDDVARYQKDALTGHRPTWKMGANNGKK